MTKKYSRSELMKLAIKEHLKCSEFPRVGVVVAKNKEVLSTGYRGETRGVHAERMAIRKLSNTEVQGSIVFTTLEPCVELHDNQEIDSCAQLLIDSGVSEVVIGILDPNGTIYSKGYKKLLENNVKVGFFNKKLIRTIEKETFEFADFHKIYGCGKRRVPVVHSGISLKVQFSKNDPRIINIKWQTLQANHKCVDLLSDNGAVRVASGARNFGDITDPIVFRFPSHFARMKEEMIAIVKPSNTTFYVLIQLLEISDNDIIFKWEVRNDK